MISCVVALVLLLDTSSSIQLPDWVLQVEGHAAAFEDPRVHRAIERGPGVAVTALAFGQGSRELVPWTILRGEEDAQDFAADLRNAQHSRDSATDIGGALSDGIQTLARAPCRADQEVIDLVTDGEADPGPARRSRAAAHALGIRINAVGVGAAGAGDWLRENAVTPSGFAIQISDWEAFAPAIRRKIEVEVANR